MWSFLLCDNLYVEEGWGCYLISCFQLFATYIYHVIFTAVWSSLCGGGMGVLFDQLFSVVCYIHLPCDLYCCVIIFMWRRDGRLFCLYRLLHIHHFQFCRAVQHLYVNIWMIFLKIDSHVHNNIYVTSVVLSSLCCYLTIFTSLLYTAWFLVVIWYHYIDHSPCQCCCAVSYLYVVIWLTVFDCLLYATVWFHSKHFLNNWPMLSLCGMIFNSNVSGLFACGWGKQAHSHMTKADKLECVDFVRGTHTFVVGYFQIRKQFQHFLCCMEFRETTVSLFWNSVQGLDFDEKVLQLKTSFI